MSRLKGLAARARSLFGSSASEARMEEEFRFHVEMETKRLIGEGMAAHEARRRALVTFGGWIGTARRCAMDAAPGGSPS